MTLPIQSAKTAQEMLEAVCEDLERSASNYGNREGRLALKGVAAEYRAILKEME